METLQPGETAVERKLPPNKAARDDFGAPGEERGAVTLPPTGQKPKISKNGRLRWRRLLAELRSQAPRRAV